MKLIVLYNKECFNYKDRLLLLRKSAELHGVNFESIDSEEYNYSRTITSESEYLLYNATPGNTELENLFLTEKSTSFYKNNPMFVTHALGTLPMTMNHIKYGLKGPKTILYPNNFQKHYKSYIDFLGGFPIVLKCFPGSKGIGTIHVDSYQSLFSLVDFLNNSNQDYILREYIANEGTFRLVVVGNEVVASIFRKNHENDFRVANKFEVNNDFVVATEMDCNKLAIHACQVAGIETAGVDIILKENEPHLLEVNFPHDFATPELKFNLNISNFMIKHLVEKTLANNGYKTFGIQ